SVRLEPRQTEPRRYRAMRSVRLTTVYPIVEAYREHVAVGWHADASDPMLFHDLGLGLTWTPAAGVPARERLHVAARYRRYDLSLAFHWTPASFYDLVGPTKLS